MARVCQLSDDLKYYLCMKPVDMRKQFHGLQGIVNEEFGRYRLCRLRLDEENRRSCPMPLRGSCPSYGGAVLEGKSTVAPDSVALLPSPLSCGGDNQGKRVDWRGKDQVLARACGAYMGNFRAWVANTILDVPKDSLIFRAQNYLLRNHDELTHYLSIPRDADRQHGY